MLQEKQYFGFLTHEVGNDKFVTIFVKTFQTIPQLKQKRNRKVT
jgi:hypothetical protein